MLDRVYHQGPFHSLFSCLALNDLIRGRQAGDIIDRLSEIWETLFRVLDDIKVRNKAKTMISCQAVFERLSFFSVSCTVGSNWTPPGFLEPVQHVESAQAVSEIQA